ncbi:prepilin-type N-terminal cleavage/methylation domain-containing protein [Marinobacter adhaerens]|jgi:MSHA pilin protein MshA|uniref:prepilin-type N-terminal cleavage/methylation domain-containing protein n=1 Tax=Marinobacter adhaerens TaxID=1033846 RepID=UPI003BAC31A8|nr:prepilin-type N-terminal cleavage/methylation domain-containing protein [Marinobacter adhaerens]
MAIATRPEKQPNADGFTLIELVLVVVILGVLAAFALPRFSDLSTDARLAALESLEGTMKSTIGIVRSKAYAQGLSPAASNPGGIQTNYVIETEAGRSEVDWRNLCPESRAEADDTLTMLDYISVDANDSSLETFVDNQYTRVGFSLPAGSGAGPGCYVEYDSFGDPECTVTQITSEC